MDFELKAAKTLQAQEKLLPHPRPHSTTEKNFNWGLAHNERLSEANLCDLSMGQGKLLITERLLFPLPCNDLPPL